MTSYIVSPTPSFRVVTDVDGERLVQQRCLVTEGAGGAKERRFAAWLDVNHDLFAAVESPAEAHTRKLVEDAHDKNHSVTITHGGVT